jgi:hypothetical protein
VIAIVIVTLTEGVADELASMVTVPSGGMEPGAIKVAGSPLAVCRVMEPQSAAKPVQVRSQLTPRFPESLVTVAANCVAEFAATEGGGAICPWAKAMVTVAGLLVLHPLQSKRVTPHKIDAMPLTALILRPVETDLRFISTISESSLLYFKSDQERRMQGRLPFVRRDPNFGGVTLDTSSI